VPEEDRPILPSGADPKERFFWRLGGRPEETGITTFSHLSSPLTLFMRFLMNEEFPNLKMAPVIPRSFPEWEEVMNTWGYQMLTAITTVTEMLEAGFDLPHATFSQRMKFAPHILAPTGRYICNSDMPDEHIHQGPI